MTVIPILKPLAEPKKLPSTGKIDMKPAKSVLWLGAAVIAVTIALYIIFW